MSGRLGWALEATDPPPTKFLLNNIILFTRKKRSRWKFIFFKQKPFRYLYRLENQIIFRFENENGGKRGVQGGVVREIWLKFESTSKTKKKIQKFRELSNFLKVFLNFQKFSIFSSKVPPNHPQKQWHLTKNQQNHKSNKKTW